MKKIISLLLVATLLFAVACAESEDWRAFYNPNEYPLLKITDAFPADDGSYLVQGTFGDIDTTEEWNAKWIGFDTELVFTLKIAEDAEIEMPASIFTLVENLPATREDVVAFVEQLRAEGYTVDFYCHFEMNEEGLLTRLTYCHFPY